MYRRSLALCLCLVTIGSLLLNITGDGCGGGLTLLEPQSRSGDKTSQISSIFVPRRDCGSKGVKPPCTHCRSLLRYRWSPIPALPAHDCGNDNNKMKDARYSSQQYEYTARDEINAKTPVMTKTTIARLWYSSFCVATYYRTRENAAKIKLMPTAASSSSRHQRYMHSTPTGYLCPLKNETAHDDNTIKCDGCSIGARIPLFGQTTVILADEACHLTNYIPGTGTQYPLLLQLLFLHQFLNVFLEATYGKWDCLSG